MKKLYFLAIASIISLNSFSQAILPSFYNFENFTSVTSLPSGWTSNITGTYTYNGGQVGKAARLDQQGEYVQIQTADPIGTLNYYLKGNYGSPATFWTGTFKVQESTDGTTWSDLASYTSFDSTNYQAYSVSPATLSRYVRFFFDTKVLGSNVGLDEVTATSSSILNTSNIEKEELLVFPNPVSGNQLNIRSSKKIVSIQLSNLIGQVVYSNNNPEMNDLITSINVEKFPKGIYYLNIVNQDQTSNVKKVSIR
jgi:hypothetical protein